MKSLARQLLWLFLAIACVRAPPEPPAPPPRPPPPPPVVVPEGCLADLSGAWVHEIDERFRYELADVDGGVRVLAFFEQPVDAGPAPRRFSRNRDGGLAWLAAPPDAGDATSSSDAGASPRAVLHLTRTPAGFVGASVAIDGGCRFPTRIVQCQPSLVIESPATLAADCAELDAGWSPQRLRRIAPDGGSDTLRHEPSSDGGEPDAGDERAAPAP